MCLPGRGKATGFSVARPHFPVIGQARDDDSESVPTSNNNVVYPGALKRRRVLLFLSCRTCRMRSEFRGSSLCSAAFRPHVARNHAHALARGQHVHGAGNGRRQACPLPWRATRCMGRAMAKATEACRPSLAGCHGHSQGVLGRGLMSRMGCSANGRRPSGGAHVEMAARARLQECRMRNTVSPQQAFSPHSSSIDLLLVQISRGGI
jgi:hypothetical protein